MCATRCTAALALTFALLPVADAAAHQDPGAQTSVRDSAGVMIIVGAVPDAGPADRWRIDPEPVVSIGVADGAAPYLFTNVQLAGRMADGRMFVVDDAAHRSIRTYDQDGQFVEAFGGAGQGPGEFGVNVYNMIAYRGDSLAVVEYLGRRIHIFDGDGRFGRRIVPAYGWRPSPDRLSDGACCRPQAALSDGTLIVQYPSETPTTGSGLRRGAAQLVRVSPDGAEVQPIATVPSGLGTDAPRGYPVPVMSLLFSGRVLVAVHNDRILVGNGVEYRVDELDRDGRLVRSLRVDREPPAFDAAAKSRYLAAVRERQPSLPEREDASVRRALPDRLPVYSRILVDPRGRIWLLSHPLPYVGTRTYTALVLDPNGTVLGEVEFPENLVPLRIGRDEVFGLRSDDLGVDRVVVHRIVGTG
jgi:hypothetical protein